MIKSVHKQQPKNPIPIGIKGYGLNLNGFAKTTIFVGSCLKYQHVILESFYFFCTKINCKILKILENKIKTYLNSII